MKKHLATFAAALLLLGACSKNDDNPTPPTPNPAPAPTPAPPAEERSLFPKKAKVTTDDGSYETIYTVSNGKLISIKNLRSSVIFTYEADRIIKKESENSDGDHSTDSYIYYENGLLKTKVSDFTEIIYSEGNNLSKRDSHKVTSYTYDNQKRLTRWVEDETTVYKKTESGTTTTYKSESTYTADYSTYPKVIVKNIYKSKIFNQPPYTSTTEYHSTFDDKGRVVHYERFDVLDKVSETATYTYEGGKHNPLASEVFLATTPESSCWGGLGADYLLLTHKRTAYREPTEETTYENTYDDREFPIKIVEKNRYRNRDQNGKWEPWKENTKIIEYEY